jgi:hypothetical protein
LAGIPLDPKLDANSSNDGGEVLWRQCAEPPNKPLLAGSGDRVGHGFAPFTVQADEGLGWVETRHF